MPVMGNPMSEALLICGHAGHEVRCHGWMERNRPLVLILTSGGGESKTGRTDSSRRVIERAGARCCPLMGSFSDGEIYRQMSGQDPEPLAEWTRQAAAIISSERPRTVLTDMVEGFNSTHDIIAYLTHLAVELASRQGARPEHVLCHPLEGRPDRAWEGRLSPVQTLRLDDGELARKLDAARGYPELAFEVERALTSLGEESFRSECLYQPMPPDQLLTRLPDAKPLYETFGEKGVASGKYASVIRHADHIIPLGLAIRHRLGL
jgi:LmbE family N-acetylglucosaminyl deacetylase